MSRPVFRDTSPVFEPWKPQVGDLVKFRYSKECVCPNCGQAPGHKLEMDGIIAQLDYVCVVWCNNCKKILPGHHYGTLYKWGAAACELELVSE